MPAGSPIAFAIVAVAITFAIAQDTQGEVIMTATNTEHGPYLTDGEGRALYVFTEDGNGAIACVDECAVNWPPLLLEGEVGAGKGVAASLIGSIERPDGLVQVTYSGRPLYHFLQDEQPGDTKGQALNDSWYLISAFGVAIVPKAPAVVQEAAQDEKLEHMVLAMVLGEGRTVFEMNCATCHGMRGEGGLGPRLAGGRLDEDRRVIRQVLLGGQFMPGFGADLTDEQIAAVITYIRKSWNNDFLSVTPEEVMTYR